MTPQLLARELHVSFTSRTFSDAKLSPYAREINTLAAYQLLSGDESGAFRPEEAITRGDFCAMVAQALGLYGGEAVTFTDVPQDAPYAAAVSSMVNLGFISGYGDGTFRPDEVLTYEQAIAVLGAAAIWANMDSYNLSETELNMDQWLEYHDYADWSKTKARDLSLVGALLEDVDPQDQLTREMAAAMLCRMMEGTGLIWD